MPLLKIQINTPVSPTEKLALLKRASSTVSSMLGKSEQYVMVTIEQNSDMIFAAEHTPLAYLELKSIGLPREQTSEFSNALTNLISENLNIPADRIYIEFSDAERHMWGWNGGTF